jgi:uncharacterized membrane protein
MLKTPDLIALTIVVAAVIWLNVPTLLLPAVVLSAFALSAHRWRREGRDPDAADRYRSQLFASCILLAAISVPLILRLVPPNGTYGFRTRMTSSSPEIWYAANAFMGWALLVSSIVAGGALLSLPRNAGRLMLLAMYLMPLGAAVAASFIYLQHLS